MKLNCFLRSFCTIFIKCVCLKGDLRLFSATPRRGSPSPRTLYGSHDEGTEQERAYVSYRIPEAKRVVSDGVWVKLLKTNRTWTQMKEMWMESCWDTSGPDTEKADASRVGISLMSRVEHFRSLRLLVVMLKRPTTR
jgi:hypothetical protein